MRVWIKHLWALMGVYSWDNYRTRAFKSNICPRNVEKSYNYRTNVRTQKEVVEMTILPFLLYLRISYGYRISHSEVFYDHRILQDYLFQLKCKVKHFY